MASRFKQIVMDNITAPSLAADRSQLKRCLTELLSSVGVASSHQPVLPAELTVAMTSGGSSVGASASSSYAIASQTVPLELWASVFPWEVQYGMSRATAAQLKPLAPMLQQRQPRLRGMLFVHDETSQKHYWSGGITHPLDVFFLQKENCNTTGLLSKWRHHTSFPSTLQAVRCTPSILEPFPKGTDATMADQIISRTPELYTAPSLDPVDTILELPKDHLQHFLSKNTIRTNSAQGKLGGSAASSATSGFTYASVDKMTLRLSDQLKEEIIEKRTMANDYVPALTHRAAHALKEMGNDREPLDCELIALIHRIGICSDAEWGGALRRLWGALTGTGAYSKPGLTSQELQPLVDLCSTTVSGFHSDIAHQILHYRQPK